MYSDSKYKLIISLEIILKCQNTILLTAHYFNLLKSLKVRGGNDDYNRYINTK